MLSSLLVPLVDLPHQNGPEDIWTMQIPTCKFFAIAEKKSNFSSWLLILKSLLIASKKQNICGFHSKKIKYVWIFQRRSLNPWDFLLSPLGIILWNHRNFKVQMWSDKIFYPYHSTFRKDWLSITDGKKRVKGPYCNSRKPKKTITLELNVAGVYFRSDKTGNRKGFEIKYTCKNESPGMCWCITYLQYTCIHFIDDGRVAVRYGYMYRLWSFQAEGTKLERF